MFSAQISHEIRTPLNAVIGFSEALSAGLIASDPARTGEYLAMISSASRDLDRTLSRLLDASGHTDARSGARSGA